MNGLCRFILWLHQQRKLAGLIQTNEAERFIEVLQTGQLTDKERNNEDLIAAEQLALGVPLTRDTKAYRIRHRAYRELRSQSLTLAYIDAVGYTPLTVRAILEHHFYELKNADLDTNEYCTYIDISSAVDKLNPLHKALALMTRMRFTREEIEDRLKIRTQEHLKEMYRQVARHLGGYRAKETPVE